MADYAAITRVFDNVLASTQALRSGLDEGLDLVAGLDDLVRATDDAWLTSLGGVSTVTSDDLVRLSGQASDARIALAPGPFDDFLPRGGLDDVNTGVKSLIDELDDVAWRGRSEALDLADDMRFSDDVLSTPPLSTYDDSPVAGIGRSPWEDPAPSAYSTYDDFTLHAAALDTTWGSGLDDGLGLFA